MKRNRVPNVETGENEKGRREQKATGCTRRRGEERRGEENSGKTRGRVACPLRGNEDVCALPTRN